jgi:predicted transposase YdaD
MGMARSEHPRVLLTSLQMLARLGLDAARTRLISGFIDTYLHLTAHEQAQYEAELAELTPQEQEATMELTTSWKEEGIQEGLREGKQKATRNLIIRQLTRRFGALAPELEARIGELSLPQLETLAEELLDFASIDDLHSWLSANPPGAPEEGASAAG